MATVPGAPVLQQPRPLTLSQELEFYWAEPASDGGSAITSYIIFDGTTSNTLPSNTRSYKATGLANGTVYQYRVAASNSIGLGDYSFFRAVQPGLNPDIPTNVSYTDLSNLRYNITWLNPTNTGQASLTRGFLQAIPVDGEGNILSNVSSFIINRSVFGGNAGSSNSRVLSLTSNYNYRVLVRVVNDPGYSLPITYTSTIFTAPFSPTGIASLRLWLDATASSNFTLSTNYVSTWTDRSANATKISQTTASNFPTFSTNFVSFSTFQYLNFPATAITNVSTWTMMFYFVPRASYAFITAKTFTTSSNAFNILSYGATTTSAGLFTGGLSTTMYLHTSNGGTVVNYPIGFSTNTVNLVEIRYNAQSNLTLWNNGFLWSTIRGDFRFGNVVASQSNTIGALFISSVGLVVPSTSAYSLGSMLYFSSILAPSNTYKLQGYLANQYGLQSNLPVNHPYYNTQPTATDTQLNFSPSSISSLQLWLDANDATSFSTIGSTSSITRWVDRSGNNRHASTLQSGNPFYVPNGIQSGRAGVFISTGSTLVSAVPAGTFASSVTSFTVFQKVGLGPAAETLIARASNTFASPFYLYSNQRPIGDGPSGGQANVNSGFNINTISTVTILGFTANRFSTFFEYQNGILGSSNLTTSNYYRDGASSICFGLSGANTQPYTGYLSETLFYSSTLTFGERQAVEGYLAWKWGTESTLSTIHPFRFQPPTVRSLYEGSNGSFFINNNNNSTIIVPTDADLRLGTGDFTCEWWQWIDNSVGSYIWGYGIQNAADMFVTAQGTNKAIRPWFNGTALSTFTIPNTISTLGNSWHHYALVRSTGTLRCFYDGMSSPTSISFNSNLSSSVYNLHLGYVDYKGYLGDFHITKGRALYWSSNFAPPATFSSNVSTVLLLDPTNRGRSQLDKGPLRKTTFSFAPFIDWTPNYWPDFVESFGSLYATGATRYATVAIDNDLRLRNSSFTIEYFAYQQGADTNSFWGNGFYNNPPSAENYIVQTTFSGGANMQFAWGNGFPATHAQTITTSPNTRVGWSHYAITRNISTVRIFQNGIQMNTNYNDSAFDINPTTSGWFIGAQQSNGALDGYITNFHIVKGQALYVSTFTPPSIPIQSNANTVLLLRFASSLTVDSGPLNKTVTAFNSPSWYLATRTQRPVR